MEIDPKLVILIITNQLNGQELFRIHVHELTIRFDDKFQEGIDNNGELKREIETLNVMWRQQKIQQNSIFPIMLDIMYRYGDYIKDYYFDNSELDSSGQFIDIPKSKLKPEVFFDSLKGQKLLTKITKKKFQESIKSHAVAEKYVDVYQSKSKYFHYQLYKISPLKEDWFFMEHGEKLKLCFMNR